MYNDIKNGNLTEASFRLYFIQLQEIDDAKGKKCGEIIQRPTFVLPYNNYPELHVARTKTLKIKIKKRRKEKPKNKRGWRRKDCADTK